jgi:carbonic anhydrase
MSVRMTLAVFTVLAVSGCRSMAQDPCKPCPNLSPSDPWAELEAGNERFVHGPLKPHADGCRRDCTKETQKPYAIALSCSDSRVPPEIAFDQRIGDLFVVRIAGNVATDVWASSSARRIWRWRPA